MKEILLIAVDGSDNSLHAVEWLVSRLGIWKEAPEVHLLNVQPSLHGDISRFVSARQVEEFHQDSGHEALAAARQCLERAGVALHAHIRVGETAAQILELAKAIGCTQIVMGTRGRSGLSGFLLGSVAARVIPTAEVPVTLVGSRGEAR